MNELLPASGYSRRLAADSELLPSAAILSRPSPLMWYRSWRAEREARRAETAHQRLVARMDLLGDEWRVLDLKEATGIDRTNFLAVGPGGVFAVTIKDHGRSRISFAGDVVQVEGRRPRYVAEARRNAQLAAEALTRRAGVSIPVMPVLAFAGSGTMVFHGLPKGCMVTSYQDLHRVLTARGRRISAATIDKVFAVATQPQTWVNEPYVTLAERYRWYSDGSHTGADKRPAPR